MIVKIRKTEKEDLPYIMEIVCEARRYFAENSIPQWQGEYPSERDFEEDIEGGRSFVATDDTGTVLGVYCFDTRGDENYNEIFEGAYSSSEPYSAIHRVAVCAKAKGMGIAGKMVSHAVEMSRELGFRFMRGDTHRLNISMQRMLEKNGFKHCGIIYLGGKKDSENERFAYEMEIV